MNLCLDTANVVQIKFTHLEVFDLTVEHIFEFESERKREREGGEGERRGKMGKNGRREEKRRER